MMSHTITIWEMIIERRLREETSEMNILVSFQVEGRRMQYSLCGNLRRNVGKTERIP